MAGKILLVILIISSNACETDAQWYTRQYGAEDINDLSMDQMKYSLDKAVKLRSAGITLTISGSSAMLLGFIMANNSMKNAIDGKVAEEDAFNYAVSIVLVYAGFASDAAGMPLWVIGGKRKKDITYSHKYLFSNSMSLEIHPDLSYNNYSKTYCPGIRIILDF